jgi:hypothetical protein
LRCTATIDRDAGLFKHTRCTLAGWVLDPVDEQLLAQCHEPEYVLSLPPKALLLRLAKDPHAADSAEPAIYELTMVSRSWCPDQARNVHINRTGFQVVPDFAGTIHSFVGSSLEAAMLDCLHFGRTPSREDMLRAYLGISRVTKKEGLLIVRPYHPMLFRQGALPGPELLMQFWRGEVKSEELEAKWEEAEAAPSKVQKRWDKMKWKCYGPCGCSPTKGLQAPGAAARSLPVLHRVHAVAPGAAGRRGHQTHTNLVHWALWTREGGERVPCGSYAEDAE